MAQFYVLLTQTGQAKMANALALGTTIDITEMAVGDGGGVMPVPDSDREEMVNEVRRAPVNRIEVDSKNPNWLIVEQVLPPDIGGWTIREVGLFDADGDLIGYGNYPETYKPTLDQGSGRTLTIRMVLEVSHTAAVTLRVDPSVVLATREYVDDALVKSVADQDTVNAGENDTRFVTPKKLKAWALQWVKQATETVAGMLKVATQTQVDAGEDDETAVTPKKMRWGFEYYFADTPGGSGYIIFPTWLASLIIQWGSQNGSTLVYYPISFPNTCMTVQATDSGSSAAYGVRDLRTNRFEILTSDSNYSLNWLALGY